MRLKPHMVSLEDFGKPAPPPAKAPFPVVAYSILTAIVTFILVGGYFAYDWMRNTSLEFWNRSSEIADQGRFNTR